MPKVEFSENLVTLGDLIQHEHGRTIEQTANFLAKFVVADDGSPMSDKERLQFVIGLSLPEGRALMSAFWRFMGGVKTAAVNPPSATP